MSTPIRKLPAVVAPLSEGLWPLQRCRHFYRERVARLEECLNDEAVRYEAAEALRGLIQEIRLLPEENQLEIELIGSLDSMLAFPAKSPASSRRRGRK